MTDAELAVLVEEMRRIHRGEVRYGDGEGAAAMTSAFRRERLLPEMVRRARARFETPPSCSLLVSLAGFSPETTILAWEILRPPEVLVLWSKEARDSVDVIDAHLRERGLRASRIHREAIDPTDVRGIYEAIERATRRHSPEPSGTILDITGGKKLMSAAGALAASQLHLRLAYVDGDVYDPELRAPVPGTERLVLIPSPGVLFASEREREAEALFESGAYGEARERFKRLADTLERPASARLHLALATLYGAWMDLDLDGIGIAAAEVEAPLRAAGLSAARTRVIEEQVDWFRQLADRRAPADLHLCFVMLGRHYLGRHRHDFAALLFYRAIEGALGERLRGHAPGLDLSAPDYGLFGDDEDALARRYASAIGRSGRAGTATLPGQLGFLSSATLLVALGETLDLGRLRHLAEIRNGSVLAHGTTPVSRQKAEELERMAQELLGPEAERRTRRLAPLGLGAR